MFNRFSILFSIIVISTINGMNQNDNVQKNNAVLGRIEAVLKQDLKVNNNNFVEIFVSITKSATLSLEFKDQKLILQAEKKECFARSLFQSQLSISFSDTYGEWIKQLCKEGNHMFKLFPNEDVGNISLTMIIETYDREWDIPAKLSKLINKYKNNFSPNNK